MMTAVDLRARDLERRWKEGGDRADWVRWLRARLRRGDLDAAASALVERAAAGEVEPADLALAAYLGDPVALAIDQHEAVALAAYLGDVGAAHVVLGEAPTADELAAWLRGLAHWGPRTVVRALIALGDALLEVFRRAPPPRDPDAYDYPWDWAGAVAETASNALAVARDWVACPCPEHARVAGQVPDLLDPYSPYYLVLVAEQAARAAGLSERYPSWPDVLERCTDAVARGLQEGLRGAPAPAEIARAIRDGLVPEVLYGAPPLEG